MSLSPTLTLFVSPYGKLYLKMQLVIAQTAISNSTIELPKRRLGPKKPKHGIPPHEWPNVLHRVLENQEPLRTVADDYGVSHETVRRVMHATRKMQQVEATRNVVKNWIETVGGDPKGFGVGPLFSLTYPSGQISSPLNSCPPNQLLDREKSSIEIV